jgi:hypothetical protein
MRRILSIVSLASLALSSLQASAQAGGSSFAIPNPIIKPASMAVNVPAGAAGRAPAPPQGRPAIPPLPEEISPASLPGQRISTNAPGNDAIVRETLATFTVTAIVGNKAVLRNNVGTMSYSAQSTGSSGNDSQGQGRLSQPANGSGPATHVPAPRQAVIRVKTDVPVYVAGIELIPTVLDSRIEFRAGKSKTVIATVMLESLSSYGYVPANNSRETADPAVQQRVTPVTTGNLSTSSQGTAGQNGTMPLSSNGQLPTQR